MKSYVDILLGLDDSLDSITYPISYSGSTKLITDDKYVRYYYLFLATEGDHRYIVVHLSCVSLSGIGIPIDQVLNLKYGDSIIEYKLLDVIKKEQNDGSKNGYNYRRQALAQRNDAKLSCPDYIIEVLADRIMECYRDSFEGRGRHNLAILKHYNTMLNEKRRDSMDYIERLLPEAVEEFTRLKEHGILKLSDIDDHVIYDEMKMIIIPCYEYLYDTLKKGKAPFSTDSLSANYIWRVLNIIIDDNIEITKNL